MNSYNLQSTMRKLIFTNTFSLQLVRSVKISQEISNQYAVSIPYFAIFKIKRYILHKKHLNNSSLFEIIVVKISNSEFRHSDSTGCS